MDELGSGDGNKDSRFKTRSERDDVAVSVEIGRVRVSEVLYLYAAHLGL